MISRKGLGTVIFLCGLFCAPSCLFAADQPLALMPSASQSGTAQQPSAASPAAAIPSSGSSDYVLGTGDKIKLTVYGETDLSGEYEVSSTGIVSLPLIGNVPAAQHTIHDFEQAVARKLAEGYLRDPRVSAQVVNYRPFFILGEVSKPGSYPYVNGMTVINAVALAGGYTYRADKSDMTISRANDPEKKDVQVPEEARVMPGDVIRVPERFF